MAKVCIFKSLTGLDVAGSVRLLIESWTTQSLVIEPNRLHGALQSRKAQFYPLALRMSDTQTSRCSIEARRPDIAFGLSVLYAYGSTDFLQPMSVNSHVWAMSVTEPGKPIDRIRVELYRRSVFQEWSSRVVFPERLEGACRLQFADTVGFRDKF